ncbi:uncharacterized protein BDW70DRAFT_148509 [Aspergillus foveolatus]|uniref:uncharacterized protein n=1 Tax=Aspergillus foveolatus TaxID=210207 RepID=UPI003CCC8FD4
MPKEPAPEAVCLPMVAEIEAATELMSPPNASAKVTENMEFLAVNSRVPVPKIHAAFRDQDTNKTYIIMEYLPGESAICKLTKDAITKLRSVPAPEYLGMLNRRPYLDGVFWTNGLNPKISDRVRPINSIIAKYELLGSQRPPHCFHPGRPSPKNNMVKRLGNHDGSSQFRITLLDWKIAGLSPEFGISAML